MSVTSVKTTENTFDGLVIGPAGNGCASTRSVRAPEGGSSLDLSTLDEHKARDERAESFGLTKTGSGSGKIWTVKDFGDGMVQVCGYHTAEGTSTPSSSRKVSKTRATKRSEMTDETIEASLRRTKKIVREKIIMLRPTHLATFTTKMPIVDMDEFREVIGKALARLRRMDERLEYVAVYERHMSSKTSQQKFGSLHCHIAVKSARRRLPYKKIFNVWRDVVSRHYGSKWNEALCDFSPVRGSPVACARYLSKYMSKDMDNEYYEPNKRRYSTSEGIAPPKKTTYFSPPSIFDETFRTIWEEVLGLSIKKVWIPETIGAVPPIFWLSTC